MPDFVDAVDWSRPWLVPFFSLGSSVLEDDWRWRVNLIAAQQGLRNHQDLPIHFVPQTDLPAGMSYEAFISNTGGVPTRENLHDFFNALVWLSFPQTKKQLNALQAQEISRISASTGCVQPRGRLRDTATIFDENGALLVTRNQTLIDALRNHDWTYVFMECRAGFGRDWEVFLFGHALMEKLVNPFKAITAHAWPFIVGEEFFSLPQQEKRHWVDGVTSRYLSHGFTISDLTPLPVLGIPMWWPGQNDAFYRDTTVFRGQRMRKPSTVKT